MPLQIANLRAQHEQILVVVATLEDLVRQREPQMDAERIRHVLSILDSHLRLHLDAEDRRLYPEVMRSANIVGRTTAERLQQEMGGLLGAFTAYDEQWKTETIRRNSSGFSAATSQVMSLLRRRILLENETLYPLAMDIAVSVASASRIRSGPPLIFVIDDNEADFMLITEAWKEAGLAATFEYFSQARQLLERIKSPPIPELMILDLSLPRINGLELTRILRQQPGYEQLPLVLRSSQDLTRDVDLTATLGPTSYFPKPITFDEYLPFVQSMNDLIDFHRAG